MFHLLKKTVQPIKILFNSNKNNVIKLPRLNVSSIPNRQKFPFPTKGNISYSRTFHNGLILQGRDLTKIMKCIFKQSKPSTISNTSLAIGLYSSCGFLELVGILAICHWVLKYVFGIPLFKVTQTITISEDGGEEIEVKVVAEEKLKADVHQEFVSELDKYIYKMLKYHAENKEERRFRVHQKMEIIGKTYEGNPRQFQGMALEQTVIEYKELREVERKVQKFLEKIVKMWDIFSSKNSQRKLSTQDEQAWIKKLRDASMRLDKIKMDYDDLADILDFIRLNE